MDREHDMAFSKSEAVSGASTALMMDMLGLVRSKWSMPLLSKLGAGALRFSELHRRAQPISKKLLAQSLRELERYGLIERRVLPAVPPQVEYEMTVLGRDFLSTVGLLCQWTAKNYGLVQLSLDRLHARRTKSR